MLRTLPESLIYIGDLIDAVKEEDRNCEFLKNKIIMWEARNEDHRNKTNSNAFKVEREIKNRNCYRCGQYGNFKKNCTNFWNRGDFARGSPGHGSDRKQTQQLQHQFRGYGRGNRGQRGSYKGRGGYQHNDGARQYEARYIYNETDNNELTEDIENFVTQVDNENTNVVESYNIETFVSQLTSDYEVSNTKIFNFESNKIDCAMYVCVAT